VIPYPPALSPSTALFLDLDGTLFDLQPRPEMVRSDGESTALLAGLERALDGRLAVLTGRSLADADRILDGRVAAVSGSHGLERRGAGGAVAVAPTHPAMEDARQAFAAFQREHPSVILEDKGLGVCLHYRTAPELEPAVRELGESLTAHSPLHAQPGSMMFELRTPGGGKGEALRAYLEQPPFAGARPVFVGDDLTDEDGFLAAELAGGYGVIVGARRPTSALYGLPDVAAVRRWLGALALAEATA
jgi:trehalose 6-phosphate phosphatase